MCVCVCLLSFQSTSISPFILQCLKFETHYWWDVFIYLFLWLCSCWGSSEVKCKERQRLSESAEWHIHTEEHTCSTHMHRHIRDHKTTSDSHRFYRLLQGYSHAEGSRLTVITTQMKARASTREMPGVLWGFFNSRLIPGIIAYFKRTYRALVLFFVI